MRLGEYVQHFVGSARVGPQLLLEALEVDVEQFEFHRIRDALRVAVALSAFCRNGSGGGCHRVLDAGDQVVRVACPFVLVKVWELTGAVLGGFPFRDGCRLGWQPIRML
ncbi:hypothetical protein ACQPXH_31705 [Nocardia sp. CA-135953]|uniref:hypothetical protein n=1 Tax=Nocardia sp. CA-135953 TaxID=3239978 RepID=UPI003D978C1A